MMSTGDRKKTACVTGENGYIASALYMANRTARHGTSTARHYVARHPTVPCCLGPPCSTLSPGTALCLLSRAVPCSQARQPTMAVLARGCKGGDEELADPSHHRSDLSFTGAATRKA